MGGYIGSRAVNLSTTAADVSGNATIGGNLSDSGTTVTIDSANAQTVDLGDNDKIRLGDGDDLQLYHDGSNSYVEDTATGNLYLKTNGTNIAMFGGTEIMAVFAKDDAVSLYYNGSAKLATSSSGVNVTGTVTADGLTVDGQGVFQTGSGASLLTLKNTDSSISGGESIQMDWVYGDTANSTSWRQLSRFAGSQYQWFSNIDDAGYNLRMSLYEGGDFALYEDTGTTPKLFWDASAESLGIGVTSISNTLHLDSGGATTTIQIDSNTESSIDFNDKGGSAKRYKIGTNISSNDGQLEFKDMTANAERMRITSSGDLLVGKTTTDIGTAGSRFISNGQIQATASGNEPFFANRLSSDGVLFDFRKDGTTVASIRVDSGDNISFDAMQGGGSGLQFWGGGGTTPYITPRKEGGNSNGEVSLGRSSERFKDIFLSGGVVFDAVAGNATSNTLGDYEEGTWSPLLSGSSSGTDSGVGTYVKIGRTVLLSCTFNAIGTGLSGNLEITGIPFTLNPSNSSQLDQYVPLQFFHLNWDNNAKAVYGYVPDNNTRIVPYYSQDTANSTIVQGSHLTAVTYLRFTQMFETAS